MQQNFKYTCIVDIFQQFVENAVEKLLNVLKYQNFDINVKIMIHELCTSQKYTCIHYKYTYSDITRQQKQNTCVIFGCFGSFL